MKRRDLLKFGGLAAVQLGAARILIGQAQGAPQTAMPMNRAAQAPSSKADFTLRIAPITVELTPSRIISTIGYNGTSPGPLLRMREGRRVSVDVINETDVPELVHWHGLFVPAEVDGSEEEGTPMVPPHGRRRYQFVPRPAGTRWYHTHVMAADDLHRGAYTGQFGFLLVEPASHPGNYDQEVFLALRDWEPYFAPEGEEDDDEENFSAPQPERPAVLDTSPTGLEVSYQMSSINDKCMGAGEPIRVRQGERVLMHLLNASASMTRRMALPGHRFHVIALDGNPVPNPQSVDVIELAPGERVDCIVEMGRPGRWVLGVTSDEARNAGMGILVEYANQYGQPQWTMPAKSSWDYTIFGKAVSRPAPDQTIDMVLEKIPSGAGRFNAWHVNGKEYPHDREFVLKRGARYRIIFRNRSEEDHPLHMHRHTFELVDMNGTPTGGIIKDTVTVPVYGRVAIDMVADQPGLTLFHCHIQQHMDYGFKALFRYA